MKKTKKTTCILLALGTSLVLGGCSKEPIKEEAFPTVGSVESATDMPVEVAEETIEETTTLEGLSETESVSTVEEVSTVPETEDVVQVTYDVCTSIAADDVENFAKRTKKALLAKDWDEVSELLVYPIDIGEVTYENAEQVKSQGIPINDAMIADLESESCEGMFCNWAGIMMGSGVVWINEVLDDDMNSQGLKITSINILE